MVALMLADVVARSGYPKEAVSILPMSAETAAPLIEDERIKLFTFTGSARGGMGAEGARGQEEGCAGAGRQRGMHCALATPIWIRPWRDA